MRTPGQPLRSDDDLDAPIGDWSPEQQIAHMLELCEAQMESALSESDAAVDALIKAFTRIADSAQSLDAIAKQINAETASGAATAAGPELLKQAATIREQMGAAVVAFQFYDKLTQRLGHVRYSLSSLALFVCNPAQTAQREHWHRLFASLRRLYRTEEERELFQRIIESRSNQTGTPPPAHPPDTHRSGEIELF
jgi:hypothetical protein